MKTSRILSSSLGIGGWIVAFAAAVLLVASRPFGFDDWPAPPVPHAVERLVNPPPTGIDDDPGVDGSGSPGAGDGSTVTSLFPGGGPVRFLPAATAATSPVPGAPDEPAAPTIPTRPCGWPASTPTTTG